MAEKKLGEESAPTSSGRGCSGAHSRVAVMKMNRRLEDARPVECCSKVVNYSFLSLDTGPMLCTRSCYRVSMESSNYMSTRRERRRWEEADERERQ